METVMTTLAAMPGQLMAVPVEFYIFGLTLLGVALFHHRTLTVALCGLVTTVVYKLIFTGFAEGTGFAGLAAHADHEAVILTNLMLLLLGFALLANQFERSNIPEAMPRVLPDGWLGGLTRSSSKGASTRRGLHDYFLAGSSTHMPGRCPVALPFQFFAFSHAPIA
jgi:hypothetical protein